MSTSNGSPKAEHRDIMHRYAFTDEELDQIGSTLATRIQDGKQVENEKKAVVDDFKQRLSTISSEVSDLARKRTEGYEMRPVRCYLERDEVSKQRVWKAVDTGEEVRRDPYTHDDYQLELDLRVKEQGEAYKAGVDAQVEGKTIEDNPHAADTPEREDWLNGFLDAQNAKETKAAEDAAGESDEGDGDPEGDDEPKE